MFHRVYLLLTTVLFYQLISLYDIIIKYKKAHSKNTVQTLNPLQNLSISVLLACQGNRPLKNTLSRNLEHLIRGQFPWLFTCGWKGALRIECTAPNFSNEVNADT